MTKLITAADSTPAPERLLRQAEVLRLCGVSRVTLWHWRRRGAFPVALKLSPALIGWRESDIVEWQRTRPTVDLAR